MGDKHRKRIVQESINAPSTSDAEAALRVATTEPTVTRPTHCCVHNFWAVVETDGTLVRGRNVVRARRLAEGQYEVVFTEDVSRGVFVASIGRPGIATEPAGEIGVALRCCLQGSEVNKGVWIDTHDSDGTDSDRAFHLIVMTDS